MNGKNAEIVFAKAHQAHQAGDSAEAERLYKQLLRTNPRDSDARNLLGLLYLQQRRFAESATEIRLAIKVAPNNPHSLYNLGAALQGSGDTRGAVEAFRKTCELDPANSHARCALSAALNDLGTSCTDPVDAMRFYEEALALDPSNARAAINHGILQEQTGDFSGAANSFQIAIKAQPGFADAHFQLAHLKQHHSSDDELDAMVRLFETAENEDKALLAYGIANCLEKRQRYAEEFEWLVKAHALKRSIEPFDEDRTSRQFAALRSIGPDDFSRGDRGSGLVFVVGMPRSGTTLAEQVLASHPDIHGAGEVMAVAGLKVSPSMPTGEQARLAQGAADRITTGAEGAALSVETTPANFLHLGKIALLFPAAKIVHCTRDALDTCLSIFQHPLSAAHAYAHALETLGRYYLDYRKLMDHWTRVVPNPIFELRYEAVVTDLESTVRDLLEFCDVEFDPQCVRFHETGRQIRTPSASQVRQPIYRSSIGRWRRYEQQLAPLQRILKSGGCTQLSAAHTEEEPNRAR